MEEDAAADALSALGHPHRLKVFRLLMARAPAGVAAGEIARALAMAPASLSFHLAHLERAGLLRAQRVARHVFYAVDLEGMGQLVAFLTEDCCQGHPQICGYGKGGSHRADHDLSQPRLRDLAQCSCDDPELR
jgi:DNA-binding transcriptional ArsR family regulator